jgi:hypothetical protein
MKSGLNHMIGAILLMTGVSLHAQLITVQSRISTDSMMIGDQVLFTVHVEAAKNVSFKMPQLVDTLSRQLEVLFPYSRDSSREEGSLIVDHTYVIAGFESGVQLIPAQRVVYNYNNTTDTALSMPLLITVFDPEVDTTQQIKPIKPPINTPITLKEILPWIAVGAGGWLVVTLVMALIWMYREKRRDPEIFSIKPLEPAHIVAFRELDRLKEKKLWESGQVKSYYTQLTEITRRYIERLYGIPAMERTTEEILTAFRRSNTEDSLLDEMLRELLELADLVKFAKEDPLPVDNLTNLNNAYILVQKTFPLFYTEGPAEKEEAETDE